MDRFEGVVRRRPFAVGSKSERRALLLVTPRHEYVLRRQGGNPFVDPALDALVGKRVSFAGILHGYTLIVSDWQELSAADNRKNR
jgi:hypothetical protein